jgi:RHS repeat-associated protein
MVSKDAYYPFGMRIAGLSQTVDDPDPRYKYNGKELDEEKGLDWLAYGARYYDPEIGRWHVVDPKLVEFSPYNYGINDPIQYVDPNGENPGDFLFLLMNPLDIPTVYSIKSDAMLVSEQWGSTRGLPHGTGNIQDAFRHTYLAIRLTRALGPHKAGLLLAMHEAGTPGNEDTDLAQDIHNNAAGISAAMDSKYNGWPASLIVEDLLANGKLMETAPSYVTGEIDKYSDSYDVLPQQVDNSNLSGSAPTDNTSTVTILPPSTIVEEE